MEVARDGRVERLHADDEVRGLRVADASIMPLIVGGNTHAATMMIGEKAADLVAAALGLHAASQPLV